MIPGIAWLLGYTIAAEIGDFSRFATPRKLIGYTGLTPRVEQSGERDRRGPLRKNGPNHLRARGLGRLPEQWANRW
jgi:transposase